MMPTVTQQWYFMDKKISLGGDDAREDYILGTNDQSQQRDRAHGSGRNESWRGSWHRRELSPAGHRPGREPNAGRRSGARHGDPCRSGAQAHVLHRNTAVKPSKHPNLHFVIVCRLSLYLFKTSCILLSIIDIVG